MGSPGSPVCCVLSTFPRVFWPGVKAAGRVLRLLLIDLHEARPSSVGESAPICGLPPPFTCEAGSSGSARRNGGIRLRPLPSEPPLGSRSLKLIQGLSPRGAQKMGARMGGSEGGSGAWPCGAGPPGARLTTPSCCPCWAPTPALVPLSSEGGCGVLVGFCENPASWALWGARFCVVRGG